MFLIYISLILCSNGQRIYECLKESQCYGETIICDTEQDCTVQCSGKEACRDATIICPPDHTCDVQCYTATNIEETTNELTQLPLTADFSALTKAPISNATNPICNGHELYCGALIEASISNATNCMYTGDELYYGELTKAPILLPLLAVACVCVGFGTYVIKRKPDSKGQHQSIQNKDDRTGDRFKRINTHWYSSIKIINGIWMLLCSDINYKKLTWFFFKSSLTNVDLSLAHDEDELLNVEDGLSNDEDGLSNDEDQLSNVELPFANYKDELFDDLCLFL